jgi:hypothetical protein
MAGRHPPLRKSDPADRSPPGFCLSRSTVPASLAPAAAVEGPATVEGPAAVEGPVSVGGPAASAAPVAARAPAASVRSRWPVRADRVDDWLKDTTQRPVDEEEKHGVILPDTAEICAFRYESPAFRVFGTHNRRRVNPSRRVSTSSARFTVLGIDARSDSNKGARVSPRALSIRPQDPG